MSGIEELKTAIDALPDEEYIELRKWFSEKFQLFLSFHISFSCYICYIYVYEKDS
jgi:hypothetical protein